MSLVLVKLQLESGTRFMVSVNRLRDYIADPKMAFDTIRIIIDSFNTDRIGVHIPGEIYLLLLSDRVVALVFLSPREGSLFVYNVCTDKLYRKRGFMKRLLSTVIEENRSTDLILEVERENRAAVELYYKLGFTGWRSTGTILTLIRRGQTGQMR